MAAHTSAIHTYTVHRGDTLRGIAQRYCGNAGDWGSLARASGIRDANDIKVGQRVVLDCHGASARPVQTARTVGSGMQACIIRAESGGNPYIWNATGHWGLYQFSYSTWVAAGGSPGLFGHSGPSYQTRVFWDAVAKWGYSPWTPYDGC